MIDYKNLTDEEILSIIEENELNSKVFSEMKKITKEDSDFANRLLDLKIKNKSTLYTIDGEQHSLSEPGTQWVIDDLNKLLKTLPLNSPNRDKVIAKIDYYTEKFKSNG